MNNKFKRLLFSIHSWFGLITGVFLLLLGLSGSVLVFQEELDELIQEYGKNVILEFNLQGIHQDIITYLSI